MKPVDQCPSCRHLLTEQAPDDALAVSVQKPVGSGPARPARPGSFPAVPLTGIVMAVIVGVVLLIAFTGAHDASSNAACRGEPDKLSAFTDYRSNDGVHWTGTYPCLDGGQTTVPVPRSAVYGEPGP